MSMSPLARQLSSLATPVLVIDAQVLRRNILKMAHYAQSVGLGLRPHVKTSKSRQIVAMLREAGAVGIAASKVTEAEVLADPGDDLLLAYPPVGLERPERLANLGKDRTVRAAIDSALALQAAAAAAQEANVTIGLLVDVDVGLGRTGVQSSGQALELAQQIEKTRGVRLDGIMVFPGHIWHPPGEQADALGAVSAILEETLDLWKRHGLVASIVSGGSTPTAYQSHLVKQYTEIRPGTYIFNDMNTVRGGFCSLEDCAARVVCTVISDAAPGQVVTDAGSKTLASDLCLPARESGYGHVVEYPEARIAHLSEEHGRVDTTACARRPTVGERLTVIPNHICPCVNLQDTAWWIEPNEPPRLLPIDARGKLI